MSVQAAPAPHVHPPVRQVTQGGVGLPGCRVGRRLLAHLIDLVLVAALGAAIYLLTGSVLLAGVVAGEVAVGLAVWEARSGRTVGKQLLGVRAAQEEADYAPGLRRGVVRSVLLGAAHVLALVGQFLLIATSALDRTGRGRAWHDRVARTRVVDVRAAAVAPAPRYAPPSADSRGLPSTASGELARPGQIPAAAPGTHASAAPAPGYVPSPARPHGSAPGPGYPAAAPGYGSALGVTGTAGTVPPPGQVAAAAGSGAGVGVPPPGPAAPPPHGAGTPPPAPAPQVPPAPAQPAPAQPGEPPSQGHAGTPPSSATAPPPGTGSPQGRPAPAALPEHTFDPAGPTGGRAAAPAARPARREDRVGAPADPRTLDPSELPDLDDRRDTRAGAVFVLSLDDGKSVTVSGEGLIGRRPQPRPGEQVAHLVAVDDPGRSLSRTHAAFGIDGEDLWVEDRGSANGTVVVGPAGETTRALPGKRVLVPADGRIGLGERTVTVHRWYA